MLRDEELIGEARHEAAALVAQDPDLSGHPHLLAALASTLDEGKDAYLERT